MTKTTKTSNAKTTAPQADDARNIIMDAVETLQENITVPEAAREFVAQQAATAQEHTDAALEGAAQFNARFSTQAEQTAVSFLGSYAGFTKTLIDMTSANVNHALATVEKLAASKSLTDAMQIQADYLRDSAKANYDRFSEVAGTVSETVSKESASAQETAAKACSTGAKAA